MHSQPQEAPESLWLDEFDVLRKGAAWVALSPLEGRIMRVFLGRIGGVATRDELALAAWPEHAFERNRGLGVPLTRLRRKLRPLAVEVRPIRRHGYALEMAAPPPSYASDAARHSLTA